MLFLLLTLLVSIPKGSIKRVSGVENNTDTNLFQFQKVRLKEGQIRAS